MMHKVMCLGNNSLRMGIGGIRGWGFGCGWRSSNVRAAVGSSSGMAMARALKRTKIGAPKARILSAQRRGLLTSSYSIGPSEPPLLPHTIPQHFSSIVSSHGDRPALISRSQNERLTYRELDERSTALAFALRERGVRKGDRVAVSLGSGWECGVATYGVWKAGGVLVSCGWFSFGLG
ncbi:hypothetical protein ONS96_004737 [Cadophora gregata f. sp. sojae]|nr:hypothetical protein ONS96_004737 [Cadophora gregata f. sp. sojae]